MPPIASPPQRNEPPTLTPREWTINLEEVTRFHLVDPTTGMLGLSASAEPTKASTTGATKFNISDAINPSKFIGMAVNPDNGKLCEYRELSNSSIGDRWQLAFCIEWGRLFQGFTAPDPKHSCTGTNTCHLIHPRDMPPGKKPTYIRICSNYREQKADPYRVRCTVGGNLIDFPGDKSTRTADLVTVKCLANSIISTPGGRAASIDIKDFYLNNDLPYSEYVRFKRDDIPQPIWDQCNLDQWVTPDGYLYARVDKGMYGLPQAGKVASDVLNPRLAAAGYYETGVTPGLFKHKTNSIVFALVVDDFLVQYTDLKDFQHLVHTLEQYYPITTDMKADKFVGIDFEWNYEEGHVTLSMPGYCEKALQRFMHPAPTRPQHAPYKWTAPNYGASCPIRRPRGHLQTSRQTWNQAPTGSHWNSPILRQSSGQHHAHSPRNHCQRPISRNRENHGCHHPSTRLHSNPP